MNQVTVGDHWIVLNDYTCQVIHWKVTKRNDIGGIVISVVTHNMSEALAGSTLGLVTVNY